MSEDRYQEDRFRLRWRPTLALLTLSTDVARAVATAGEEAEQLRHLSSLR